VRLKSQSSVFYFDCVAHAMMRGGEVQGITVLGRDVTALRKNEARFTELFESLQEGIYITTPDGAIVTSILRWCACWLRFQGRIVEIRVPEIFVDRAERKTVQDEVDVSR